MKHRRLIICFLLQIPFGAAVAHLTVHYGWNAYLAMLPFAVVSAFILLPWAMLAKPEEPEEKKR